MAIFTFVSREFKLSKANTTLCRVFNISENNEAKTVEISRKTLASEMSLLCTELILILNITKEYLYMVLKFLAP
jgi:nucleosome binding factor SPN SPT16 subunit